MPEAPPRNVQGLLEGLNEPQRDAVTHGAGPLLILAGAGSGKTRVLTHRIAHLIHTKQARADEILAITFTNKAAQEMRERVELLVGRATRAMWVMTFHSACARMLRAEAHRLGYTRQFTIYDAADQRRLIKRCLDDLDIDAKRFTPRAMQAQISDAKNKLRSAEDYRQLVGSYFEQTVADVYEEYERQLHRMNAMDFDDLLVRAVNVLELFQEVRDRYAKAFKWVLVDEYQDTNHAQYRWLQLLASEHRNLAVVGDDAQCLVEGTPVSMADGSTRPIEDVSVGDQVLSSYGSGDLRAATVTGTHVSAPRAGVAIETASGRRIVSTRSHMHFAGYRPGMTPQLFMTYLMRRGTRFRVGTSRTYTDGATTGRTGVQLRAGHEHADGAWVISTHDDEPAAREAEAMTSLRYGLPTLPFVARQRGNGLVGDQERIDRIFEAAASESGGISCLMDEGLSWDIPHHTPRTFEGRRRVVTVTLCADRRGRTPMHSVAVGGRDAGARAALEAAGLSVRPAKTGSASWRYESVLQGLRRGDAGRRAHPPRRAGPDPPGRPARSHRRGAPLHAGGVGPPRHGDVHRGRRPRRRGVGGAGRARPPGLRPRRGRHAQLHRVRAGHPQLRVLVPRSRHHEHPQLPGRVRRGPRRQARAELPLDADHPLGGLRPDHEQPRADPKRLWTDIGEGDPIKVRELDDEHAEARYVAAEIERLVDEGCSRAEIAVFYRTNAQSRVLEDMLVRAQIGYQVIGGTKFYERAEIRDAIAYLTLLGNPQDVGAFTRVANSPKRGLGQTSLGRVIGPCQHDGPLGLGRRGRAVGGARPGRGGAEGARPLHVGDGAAARARAGPARPSASCSPSCSRRRATPRRSRPSGRSRRRPAREPRGARAGSPRSTTRRTRRARSASSCSRSRCSGTRTPSATTRGSSR
jgi:DNA helicase-2/ATP-dependent DNA helicase PcrA